jgi:hypothetical protein
MSTLTQARFIEPAVCTHPRTVAILVPVVCAPAVFRGRQTRVRRCTSCATVTEREVLTDRGEVPAMVLGVIGALGAVLAGMLLLGIAKHGVDASPNDGIPPCVEEDGSSPTPCYWDADQRGNGLGRSFIVWDDGTMTYID